MGNQKVSLIDFGDRTNNAILIAGQLAGLSSRLDVEALEKFLDSKPRDFRYERLCRAAIEFRRVVIGDEPGSTATTIAK